MKNQIKELRQSNGITQAELARRLGIAQSTLSYWEQGKYDIDNDSLRKLSIFFKCSADCILGMKDIQHETLENKFSANILSDHEKTVILAYRSNPAMQPAVDRLLGVSDTQMYRAAESATNHSDEIVSITSEHHEKLKSASETNDDLL